MAVVALARLGFCSVELKLGPLQLYVVPPVALRLMVLPSHTGLLLLAVAVGFAFTTTLTVAVLLQLLPLLTLTV